MKNLNKKYPFKFLNSYAKEDKAIFFGREQEIEDLYKMVFETNLMLIYGASGTGKTSIIQCGLANKFKKSQWQDLYIRRGENMNDALLTNIQKEIEKSKPVEVVEEELDWLDDLMDNATDNENSNDIDVVENQQLSKAEQIEEALHQLYLSSFKPIYLIFDQFEEIYTLGTPEEQADFIQIIKHLVNVELPVKIILAMREEYFGNLYELERAVPQLREKRLRLEPMAAPLAERVIMNATNNNSNSCITIEPKNAKRIVHAITDNIREGNINVKLPYLQVYIDRLHEEARTDIDNRDEATIFTLALVQQVGEIKEVLKNFIEKQSEKVHLALSKNATYHNLTKEVVWSVLSPFATLEGTKIPIRESELYDIAQLQNIQQHFKNSRAAFDFVKDCTHELENHRVLRYRSDDKTYEVLHDTLAKEIADKRSEEEKALLRVKRLLESQTMQGSAQELLTERQLNYIEPALEKLHLSDTEQQLIADSYKEVKRKNAEKEAQQRAKLRQARRFALISGTIAVIAIIASVFAITQYLRAKKGDDKASKLSESLNFVNENGIKIDTIIYHNGLKHFEDGDYENALIYFATADFFNSTDSLSKLVSYTKSIVEANKKLNQGNARQAKESYDKTILNIKRYYSHIVTSKLDKQVTKIKDALETIQKAKRKIR